MQQARTIVITGATRGIGRALAVALARADHRVIGCGRSAKGVARLQDELGDDHLVAAVDVTDGSAMGAWARTAVERFGAPDHIVANAAIMNRPAPLWTIPDEEWQAMLDTNIGGVVNTIRSFLPAMIERGSGVIVSLSSGWGRSTAAGVGPYCTTKWAIEGLARSLADDLPRGLASVSLNPGVIDTDMLRECWGDDAGAYPDPESWARSAMPFLLSLGAEHNGQALTAP